MEEEVKKNVEDQLRLEAELENRKSKER